MPDITDKEQYLIARGDVAIVALKAILNTLLPAQEANERMATQLQAVQAKQPPGNVTLLSISTQVVLNTALSLSSVTDTIKQALHEIEHFSTETGQSVEDNTAVENVLSAIRKSSEIYASKTDEELKKLIGL